MNAFKVSPSRNVSGFLKPSPSGRGLGEGEVSNLTLAILPPPSPLPLGGGITQNAFIVPRAEQREALD